MHTILFHDGPLGMELSGKYSEGVVRVKAAEQDSPALLVVGRALTAIGGVPVGEIRDKKSWLALVAKLQAPERPLSLSFENVAAPAASSSPPRAETPSAPAPVAAPAAPPAAAAPALLAPRLAPPAPSPVAAPAARPAAAAPVRPAPRPAPRVIVIDHGSSDDDAGALATGPGAPPGAGPLHVGFGLGSYAAGSPMTRSAANHHQVYSAFLQKAEGYVPEVFRNDRWTEVIPLRNLRALSDRTATASVVVRIGLTNGGRPEDEDWSQRVFHGTDHKNVEEIVRRGGIDPSPAANRSEHGVGVYTTPALPLALNYALTHHGLAAGPDRDVDVGGELYDVAAVFECELAQNFKACPSTWSEVHYAFSKEEIATLEWVVPAAADCHVTNALFFFVERPRDDRTMRTHKRRKSRDAEERLGESPSKSVKRRRGG